MAASDSLPVPRKNTAFRMPVAFRDSDGELVTTWSGADSEVSIDGGSYADCTNEIVEIGTSGTGYLDLTAAEMNGDMIFLKISITGAKPLVFAIHPAESAELPETSTIKTALEVDGSKLDHLWEMTENDGGVRRLTANALEQSPSGSGGETTSFSAAALAQLSGRSVTITIPAYNSNTERFDLPFTKGDSYLGGNAIQLTISNWTGQDLDLSGTTITINGTRRVDFDDNGTVETLSWANGVATSSGSNWIVEFELDTTDTDVTAGDYVWSMVAEWADGDRVTIVKKSLLTIEE